jgi:hypothetical protein
LSPRWKEKEKGNTILHMLLCVVCIYLFTLFYIFYITCKIKKCFFLWFIITFIMFYTRWTLHGFILIDM